MGIRGYITNYMQSKTKIPADKAAEQLLEVGLLLLSSGAHNGRIDRNLLRLADSWGFELETFSPFTGLLINIRDKNDPDNRCVIYKRCANHNVRFDILSDISILTWKAADEQLQPDDLAPEILKLKNKTVYYSRIQTLFGVGIACASLCMVSGGDWMNGIIAFIASFLGLFVRQELTKRNFNIFITVLSGAFVTSMIAGIAILYKIGSSPESTLATSVLYLVPGVPLINSVIDLIEGYIPASVSRGGFSGFILLAIAVGMTFSIMLLGLGNF